MLRKKLWIAPALMLVTILAAACQPAAEGEVVQVTVEVPVEVTREVTVEGEGEVQVVQAPGYGEILQRVQNRGRVVCGGRTDLLGFGYLDDDGINIGFDIDLCRAIAAAIFGDPSAVEIVPLSAAERGPAVQTGEVDVLIRNVTWTSSRDAQWGNFTTVMFYDGQGFMVPADLGVTTLEELDGAAVCVTSGTTTELNLADAFRQRGLEFTPVVFEETAAVYGAYEDGRCDATTSDMSQLAAIRAGFADPDAHSILGFTISEEPLTPAVPHGDDQWFDLVKLVMYGLINAEHLGVNQANLSQMMGSDQIPIRRMLGLEGEFGQADTGLSTTFMQDVLSAVGNYADIYDRYLGPAGAAFTLERGRNDLWTNGGVLYAPPLR